MSSTARSRALLVGAAVLVLAVFAATVVFLVGGLRGQHEEPPHLTAYADGRTISVPAFRYCPVAQPLCESERGPTAWVPVRENHPLQLSVPKQVSDAPWLLAAFYDADTTLVEFDRWFDSGRAPSAVTVPPFDDAGRPLVGVEVRLPAGVIGLETGEEAIVSHAVWSIKTTPESAEETTERSP